MNELSHEAYELSVAAGVDMGGNVRVGLEDSLYIGRGQLALSCAHQVRKIRRILDELALEIATPDEARVMTCVRWHAAYPLSLRHIEEMMAERGVFVDHAIVHRWAIKILPVLAAVFRRRKRPVGTSWRMDETYIKVSGQWKYLYRAVDRDADTVDFLLRAKRDHTAARQSLGRDIGLHGVPEKITIDKSGAHTVAIQGIPAGSGAEIEMRQSKYLNNIVEQDHRAIKRIVRPMLGFKSFRCARVLIAGIELMHMIKKGQLAAPRGQDTFAAAKFYSLAF